MVLGDTPNDSENNTRCHLCETLHHQTQICVYIYTMDLYVLFERLHLNTKLCIKQT